MERDALQEHVFSTYISLRYGIAMIAGLFPFVVWGVGAMNGIELQGSLSAYYWASDGCLAEAPSRVWLVGGLFALAGFLYLYKGFTVAENIALNLAAVFGIGVAVIPMGWDCGPIKVDFSLHGTSAVLCFICLVYVVWCRASDTLKFLDESDQKRYRIRYWITGFVMGLSPVSALAANYLLGTDTTYTFFIESAGVLAFAYYWWVKSGELRKSGAQRRALQGELAT